MLLQIPYTASVSLEHVSWIFMGEIDTDELRNGGCIVKHRVEDDDIS